MQGSIKPWERDVKVLYNLGKKGQNRKNGCPKFLSFPPPPPLKGAGRGGKGRGASKMRPFSTTMLNRWPG